MNNAQEGLTGERSGAAERRVGQREKLIACAEKAITKHGLTAIRARSLAACVGCSVGAIYNLVADLDELVLLVGQRTMADLKARLDEAEQESGDLFVGLALAYCAFAVEHQNRWRALFEFRMPQGRDVPDWFVADQMRLFDRLETAFADRFPSLDPSVRRLRTRTLFSAVHGIVVLGLEEKLGSLPISSVETELATFVRIYLSGSPLQL